MPQKSPQDKKALDYKHQKRTNWDSDKAARKAIPAAKRRKNKGIRKAAQKLLDAAKKISPLGTEDLDEIASNRRVARPTRTTKESNFPLSLKENIEQQRKRRQHGKRQYSPSTAIYRMTPKLVSQHCTNDLSGALIDFMRRIEDYRTGQGTIGGAFHRMFAEQLGELEQHKDTRLIQEFWAKEPGWKTKFDYWLDWRKRHILNR